LPTRIIAITIDKQPANRLELQAQNVIASTRLSCSIETNQVVIVIDMNIVVNFSGLLEQVQNAN
jgi:hypothetical protein